MGQEHVMRVLILLAALLIGLGAPALAPRTTSPQPKA